MAEKKRIRTEGQVYCIRQPPAFALNVNKEDLILTRTRRVQAGCCRGGHATGVMTAQKMGNPARGCPYNLNPFSGSMAEKRGRRFRSDLQIKHDWA